MRRFFERDVAENVRAGLPSLALDASPDSLAIVDNEFTLKRLDREKGRPVLRPANKAYPVIRPKEDLEIFGVVTGLFRKYAVGGVRR